MEHSSIYLAAEGYKTENKMHVDVKCQWETRAAAWFQINFITKSQGRELGSPVLLIFRKYCCCLVGSNFLTMADSLNVFSFPYYVMTAYSFVSGACVCHVLLVSCDTAKVAVYFGEHLICRLFYFSQILDGAPYIQKRCVVWRLQDLALFVANGEWYSVLLLQKRHLCTCK